MSHRVTFICDSCEKQFMIDETMDVPPHWIAIQVAMSDKDGLIPNQERDKFSHFCSQECVALYAKSDELRERSLMVDRNSEDDDDSEGKEES